MAWQMPAIVLWTVLSIYYFDIQTWLSGVILIINIGAMLGMLFIILPERLIVQVVGLFRRDLKPVMLYHYNRDTDPLYSLAHFDGVNWVCPVYWNTKIGQCILNTNGVVDRNSESSYILYWRPTRRQELMMHLLCEVDRVWGIEGIKHHHGV